MFWHCWSEVLGKMSTRPMVFFSLERNTQTLSSSSLDVCVWSLCCLCYYSFSLTPLRVGSLFHCYPIGFPAHSALCNWFHRVVKVNTWLAKFKPFHQGETIGLSAYIIVIRDDMQVGGNYSHSAGYVPNWVWTRVTGQGRRMKWGKAEWQTRGRKRDAVSKRDTMPKRERQGERGRDIMSDNQGEGEMFVVMKRCWEKKREAVLVSIICCHICMGLRRSPRERGMIRQREGRSEMFSCGQEAGCEYLIDSHQNSGGFTVLCCRAQTP